MYQVVLLSMPLSGVQVRELRRQGGASSTKLPMALELTRWFLPSLDFV